MSRLEGKTVLITGAASGIGRAACIRLSRDGACVYGIDVDKKGLGSTQELVQASGGIMTCEVCNVANRQHCFEAVAHTVETHGKLDVLLNVAGIVRFHKLPDISEAQWNLVMAVNLNGPFFLSQASIPHLLESSGNIVNVASDAGLMGQAYTAAYCASKAALIQLTKSMAMEYMKTAVRINAICPGGTDTQMAKEVNIPEDMDWSLINRYVGLRGYCQADDIASMLSYLASDEARSVHGAVISIDNGMMAG